VAVWVIVDVGVGTPESSFRLSRIGSTGVSRRRGRSPLDARKNSRSRMAGGNILHSPTAENLPPARGPRNTLPETVRGESRLASSWIKILRITALTASFVGDFHKAAQMGAVATWFGSIDGSNAGAEPAIDQEPVMLERESHIVSGQCRCRHMRVCAIPSLIHSSSPQVNGQIPGRRRPRPHLDDFRLTATGAATTTAWRVKARHISTSSPLVSRGVRSSVAGLIMPMPPIVPACTALPQ
jgi:hypothetical protein